MDSDLNIHITTISNNYIKTVFITGYNTLYNLHNNMTIGQFVFLRINGDVMQARTGIQAVGVGYAVLVENDLLMCVLKTAGYIVELQISNSSVSTRRRVTLTDF